MAIYGVFGLPRAGKTTFLTACADRALSGKSLSIGHFCWKTPIGEFSPYDRVYTNFDCKGCYKLDFDKLGIEDFSNCLILIDEIMLLCDSRDYKNFPVRLRNFLALHGHSRVDILYCSQGYADTDKRFRNLTDKIFYIQKRGSFTLVSPIEKSWRIDQDIQEGYTMCPPIGASWIYRPRYYSEFDSFERPDYLPNRAQPWVIPACDRKCNCARWLLCPRRKICQDDGCFRFKFLAHIPFVVREWLEQRAHKKKG